jgi:hypothetical protein
MRATLSSDTTPHSDVTELSPAHSTFISTAARDVTRELYFVMTDRKYTCYTVRAAPYSLFSYLELVGVVGLFTRRKCKWQVYVRIRIYNANGYVRLYK